MNRVLKYAVTTWSITFGIISVLFSILPEACFTYGIVNVCWSTTIIIIVNRVLWILTVFLIIASVYCCYLKRRRSVKIKGNGYTIVVEYGDIFDKTDCNKVIAFDECYTTHVGTAPADIKPESVCGQFLSKYPDVDFGAVVRDSGLTAKRKRSEYYSQECYDSGSLIQFNDYLLLAFAKLDKEGLGHLSREEFLSCLDLLWKEIDKHSRLKSVAIPVLGSGITRFNGESLSHQQLLDIIITSYKLSPYKLKSSVQLHIVCFDEEEVSLNKIGEYI